jgi:hypothetical protein
MLTDLFDTNRITHDIVGPGVFENIYMECMQQELKEAGLKTDSGTPIPCAGREAPGDSSDQPTELR